MQHLIKSILLVITFIIQIPAFANDADTLNITYVTSPFNMPSIIMREKGFLDNEVAVYNKQVNNSVITSGAKQTQAMAAGKIDIASVLGSSSAILAKANGAPIEIIAAFSRGPKAYTVMTMDKKIKSISDLKGKKVAGPKGTVLNQLLVSALKSQGLTLNDIEYINMDIPAASAALLSGKVDAATLAGAHVIDAEKSGAVLLADGEGLINPTTVIAARSDWVKNNPELVKAYFSAHLKAIDFIKKYPDEALEITAKEQKLSLEDAKKQFLLYDFNPVLTSVDIKNLNEDQDFMIENGMLQGTKRIDIAKDLISTSVYK
ncbi:bacterial extracellular solute-binding s, 3 family protein [Yersinia rochesterensis]|uniref:Bacterial extracellular solute-binding s, 3 family protein n=2 Tax=Yersinia rochesterensis TaxID=1604335 RepID=A0ABM5SJD7_9GAMM|nr:MULTISPECIES: NrtA/SsuA/CpmA family ABC transporter substrate-binding protein [Yersinia]AIN20397.1 bacterial extracellular solute-binding s, 3 family protein [Yersinia rochesterensis]AJI88359.1 bacterial extracellular solute-binding s, 3 family protein [Yersinia frederiksenii Y225]AJJ34467.1 bacterial extracellular solute-binding s, 3 family protein [Yersinia rochesterensis]CRY65368.1 taurine transporter substrate binding subunit [Yersinia kristensenii]